LGSPKTKGRPTFNLICQMQGEHGYRRTDAREVFRSSLEGIIPNGWHFSKGLAFTCTNVTLTPGAYLVISPNTNAFKARYPGVNNVVGNWAGTLGKRFTSLGRDMAQGAGLSRRH